MDHQVAARWLSRRPPSKGHPGFVLTPLVLGPEKVPVVTDPEQARAVPELSVLSAMAHGRRSLEAMMKGGYEYQSEFARTYVAKGREEGKLEGVHEGILKAKAADVIAVLEARGLEVPADVRERVLGSTDLAELDRWIRRAAVVSEARELFATTAS